MFALKNVCDFSNPANMKFLRTEIICDFLFCLSHYKEEGKKMRKFTFAIIQPRQRRI
mgnify:FL=1